MVGLCEPCAKRFASAHAPCLVSLDISGPYVDTLRPKRLTVRSSFEIAFDMPGLSYETRIFEKHDGQWKVTYLGYLLEEKTQSRRYTHLLTNSERTHDHEALLGSREALTA
jgi:hypothetical protein